MADDGELENSLLTICVELFEEWTPPWTMKESQCDICQLFLVSHCSLVRFGDSSLALQQDMPNMSMGEATKDGDAATSAMHSMEGTMNMGPHMRMTEHRPEQPGDAERAQPLSSEVDFWKI